MAGYPPLPHFIRFTFHTAGAGARRYPHVVAWRRLPSPLVEIATGGWIIECGREERFRVRPGEVLVLPADTPHRMTMAEGRPMTAEWTLCTYAWLGVLDVIALCGVPRVLPARAGKAIRPMLAKLRDAAPAARDADARAITGLHAVGFALLEVLLAHAARPVLAPPDAELARVMPVVRYVQDHLAENLSRARLAALAHLSPSRFHDVFKAALGAAPLEYVTRLRIQRARELLLATELPVYEIAGRCGFNSSHYFSRMFGKHAGVPPGRYRASTPLG